MSNKLYPVYIGPKHLRPKWLGKKGVSGKQLAKHLQEHRAQYPHLWKQPPQTETVEPQQHSIDRDRLYTIEEYLEACKTPRGGYNRATLAVLGVEWPPRKGWKQDIIRAVKADPAYSGNPAQLEFDF